MKKITFPLIVVGFILSFHNATFTQELPATHYTTEKEINPLPSPSVTGLWQDRLGYIWLSVYGDGLARFDGHKMVGAKQRAVKAAV